MVAGFLLLSGCYFDYGIIGLKEGETPSIEEGTPGDPRVDTGTFMPEDNPEAVVLVTGEREVLTLAFDVQGSLDLAFLIDTTRSMDGLISAVVTEFDALADDVGKAGFSEVRFGLATFDDYGVAPYGQTGLDVPFALQVSQTADRDLMQAALATTVIHNGRDAPESDLEALWQGVSGTGYDLDCDGVFTPGIDVLPFIASPTDPFGGLAGAAGTSGSGGFGFTQGHLPVIVYATNSELRDADNPRFTTPGGCPRDAGMTDVVAGMEAIGAKVVGVAVNQSEVSYTFAQMSSLGLRTGSVADLDGNGTLEPAVFAWSGTSETFRNTLVASISQLIGAMIWQRVWLEVDDPWGIVTNIDPPDRSEVHSGDTVRFEVSLVGVDTGGEPVTLTFRLVGDGGVVLGSHTLVYSAP